MILASTLSTIEAIIPYLILASVILFFVVRLVVFPLVDQIRARQRRNEHAE